LQRHPDVASSTTKLNSRFLEIASEPQLIPGVFHHCDEWCDYCPVSERCLQFRCTEEFRRQHGRAEGEPTFASLEEAIAFNREIAAVEGAPSDELDARVADGAEAAAMQTSDRLAGVALEYAIRVSMAFQSRGVGAAAERRPAAGGPGPEQVLLWYRVRIYQRLLRALLAREGKGPGGVRMDDALGSAKLVLVAVQKSRIALEALRDRQGAEIGDLAVLLDEIERGLDQRLPGARFYLRFGLDVRVV
jgi:hypothetical protein